MAVAFNVGSTTGGLTIASGTANWTTLSLNNGSGANRGLVVIALVGWGTAPNFGTYAITATYGGVAMTEIPGSRVFINNNSGANSGMLVFFGLGGQYSACPTGTNNVAIQSVSTQATEASYTALSYTGVGLFGTVVSEFGTEAGTTFSIIGSSATGRRIINADAQFSSTAVTGGNQTSRASLTQVFISARGAVQDAAGASSVTFTATRASGADYCETVLDLLEPADPSQFFVMF